MPGDADNRPLSRGSAELNHNISQRVKYIRNASRRECLRAPERGTVGGGKNVRRAAAWLGLQAVPRCSLRADQAWAVRVGLLEREVTESDVAMACDGRATAPRASQDGADKLSPLIEGSVRSPRYANPTPRDGPTRQICRPLRGAAVTLRLGEFAKNSNSPRHRVP